MVSMEATEIRGTAPWFPWRRRRFVELLHGFHGRHGDYYEYDEKNHCAVGARKKKSYRAGQRLKVKLIQANTETRKIDFMIV